MAGVSLTVTDSIIDGLASFYYFYFILYLCRRTCQRCRAASFLMTRLSCAQPPLPTLAQVSSGLQHMHACMHAEVPRDQILRNRPTRGNGHHQGNQFLKEAAERRTWPRSASGHTGEEKGSRLILFLLTKISSDQRLVLPFWLHLPSWLSWHL